MIAMQRAALLIVATLAASGCRTRLWESPEEAPLVDLATLPPDFTVPRDLATAPADLTLPFVCRNVYVFDSDGMLSSFDTSALTFSDVGKVNCPVKAGAGPDSMA